MDKEKLRNILAPFINGEITGKKKPWNEAITRAAEQILVDETDETISLLEEMYYDPYAEKPRIEVPGAHRLYQKLTARKAFS
mgnify:CR=1 FL=1